MDGSIHFEPFELVYLRAVSAGEGQNGTAPMQGEPSSHPLVVSHNWVHQVVLSSTPDGKLLAGLLKLSSQDLKALDWPRYQHHELVRYLLNASRIAQEVAATYLGVKMQPPDMGGKWMHLLDDQYRRYYSTLATLLDSHLGSLSLQYLFAWNIVHVAFASCFMERFARDPFDVQLNPMLNEQPNVRLQKIVDALKHRFSEVEQKVSGRFDELCEDLSIDPFDVHDQQSWLALHKENARWVDRIETHLTYYLRPELARISQIPFLSGEPYFETWKQLPVWIRRGQESPLDSKHDAIVPSVGIASADRHPASPLDEPASVDDALQGSPEAPSHPAPLDSDAPPPVELRDDGAAPEEEAPGETEPPRAVAEPALFWDMHDPGSSLLLIQNKGTQDHPWRNRAPSDFLELGKEELRKETDDRLWHAFAWPGHAWEGEPSETRSLSQGAVLDHLSERAKADSEEMTPIVVISHPLNPADLLVQQKLFYSVFEPDRGKQASGRTLLPFCFHLEGDWLEWIVDLSDFWDAYTRFGDWKRVSGRLDLPVISTDNECVIHILWHGFFGASFFQLMTPEASGQIFEEAERLLSKRGFDLMDAEEANMLRVMYEQLVVPRLLSVAQDM